jgi:hypothetical protein
MLNAQSEERLTHFFPMWTAYKPTNGRRTVGDKAK